MNVININEILKMQTPEEWSGLNLHCTATKNTAQIDEEGFKALIGAHSSGPNGDELTKKVFFSQGLGDGYLLLVNKIFNIFRNALVYPDEYGLSRYLKIKEIDIKSFSKDMLNQDAFIANFWKAPEIKALGLVEGSTIQEALIKFGLRKFSEENFIEYENVQMMYNLLLENGIENHEFAPDILPSTLKESFFSLVEQSMKNQSTYKLDLRYSTKEEYKDMSSDEQKSIDYLSDDKDEETKKVMAKYNMHTLSGKGISKDKIHRIVGKDDKNISMYDVTMYLCQRYKELYPNNEFPSIISSSGYKEECWMEEFYSQSIVKFNELEIGKKVGLEDCMQDAGLRISTEQMATRTIKDAVLDIDENSREEENNIGE